MKRFSTGVVFLTAASLAATTHAQPTPVLELDYEQSSGPLVDDSEPSSAGEFGPDMHAPSFSDKIADDASGDTALTFDGDKPSFADFGKGAERELIIGVTGDNRPDTLTLRTRFKLHSLSKNRIQSLVIYDGNDTSYNGQDLGWKLTVRRGKKIGFTMKFAGGAGPRFVEGETELEAGRWYEVVAQVRGGGSDEPGFIRVYLDGELDGETAIPANNGALRDFNHPPQARLTLGATVPVTQNGDLITDSASAPLDGMLDDTRLYDAVTER